MTQTAGAYPEQDPGSSNLMGKLPLILWQRRWLVLIPAVLIAVAAIAAAFLLPRTYRAKAVMLVESQSLPDPMASASLSNVIDRRIAKIREQILSRPDLVGLIQANNLYDANSGKQPLSELVERMRTATDISAVEADISKNPSRGGGSIAFQLTFDYPGAADAQMVAQTFVDRLLRLDASQTQSEAQTNVNFLEDQQAALQSQVAAVEAQINQITGRNGEALANAGGVGSISIGGGGGEESQIATLKRDNAQLESQLGGDSLGHEPGVLAAQAQLAAAKAQYTDDSPDVKLAETRLAAAKANAKNMLTTAMTAPIRQQIASNNDAIAQLEAARRSALSHAAAVAVAQSRGPVVAQQVSQLSAKVEQLRSELGKTSADLLNARSVVTLANEQRGERLTLIEPPVTPDKPSSPNRPLLIFGGILGGLVVGIGLALGLEMINNPIRSVSALTKLVGVPPLAVIPVLSARGPRAPRSWRAKLATMFRRSKEA